MSRDSTVIAATYLVSDIGTSLADIPVHLAHDTNVLVAVQQRVLLILRSGAATGGPVGLQTGIGENDDQTLGVLVMRGNWDMLLCNELRQLGRGARLGPWWQSAVSHVQNLRASVSHGKKGQRIKTLAAKSHNQATDLKALWGVGVCLNDFVAHEDPGPRRDWDHSTLAPWRGKGR